MTGPNIPLLRKMVEWVEEQEQLTEGREWFQGGWITKGVERIEPEIGWCDTTYCIAGKVAVDAGWVPVSDAGDDVEKDGRRREVGAVAAELLGIPYDWDVPLFDSSNNAAVIRRIAEDLAGEPL